MLRANEIGLGWIPDLPDFRDYTPDSAEVKQMFREARVPLKTRAPSSVDLRQWCAPVDDQGKLGSCTSHAVIGLVEYLQNRTKGEYLHASRRFLYKVTRKLYGLTGDTGAYIRGTMKALRIFGVCPEQYWQYDVPSFDAEPSAFCYAFAQAYQALVYYRLDEVGTQQSITLQKIKQQLASGLPVAFGFTVYSSIYDQNVAKTGDIPYPERGDKVVGGHAIAAVGYDDKRMVIRIRNSWGRDWGDKGYGTLPYAYVENGLARDFWVLASVEYVSLLEMK